MTQQLKAITELQMTWVQFTEPTWWLTTIYSSRYRGSDILHWPQQTPGMHTVHRHTHACQTPYTQNKNNILKFLLEKVLSRVPQVSQSVPAPSL